MDGEQTGGLERNPMHETQPHARICGAKTRAGSPCKNTAVLHNGRCRMHGGKSPAGIDSPHFRDGARSRYKAVFSGGILEHYEKAYADPRYVELREEIALLDTLIFEELVQARLGRSVELWSELERVWSRFQRAQPTNDVGTAGKCLKRLGEIIEHGATRQEAHEKALDIIERKRKLSETERRRITDDEQMISQTRALAFAASIVSIVRKHVTDRETLSAIHADVSRIVHQNVDANAGSEFD